LHSINLMTEYDRSRNHLLAELPGEEFAMIEPFLEALPVQAGDVVASPGQTIDHAYFPLSGMISVVALFPDGMGAEVATIGNEGMVGLPIFLGADSSPFHLMWQLAGDTLRIRAEDLLPAVGEGTRLQKVITTYSQAYFVHTAQNAACNGLHPVHQRAARWLLATQDRAEADEFYLTHDFLSFMLGVTRQTVSIAVGDLQETGLIVYHRGHMKILDRQGLEAASCDCYAIVRREFERLLGIGRA
jgi:CRP-like cAMP-binding protein